MNSRKGEKLVSKETIFDEKIEGYKKCGSTGPMSRFSTS